MAAMGLSDGTGHNIALKVVPQEEMAEKAVMCTFVQSGTRIYSQNTPEISRFQPKTGNPVAVAASMARTDQIATSTFRWARASQIASASGLGHSQKRVRPRAY